MLNVGQKYCRMLRLEHSAILLTFIKLPIVFKTFVLPIFEGCLNTGFTVIIHSGWSLSRIFMKERVLLFQGKVHVEHSILKFANV